LHPEFRKFRSVALADVTVVPLRARNFRYFYSITPAGGRSGPSRGISIEFQTIFKLRLIWLAIGGCARACVWEKEKKRKSRSGQSTRVCSRRRCSRAIPGWFEAEGWDIRILLSTIRFIKTARHLQTEHRLFRSIDAAWKNGSAIQQPCFTGLQTKLRTCVANVTHQFFEKGGGDELQVVTTIWHLPKPVIKKVNFSIPILRNFRNMYSKK